MGGLLSCHLMATMPKFGMKPNINYDGHCLNMAKKIGDALMPAFVLGMPYPRINLVTGIDNHESGSTCAAGVGTLLLEFGVLSKLSGDKKYELAARKALDMVWGMRSEKNLIGLYLDVIHKQWTTDKTSIGGGVDSLYEYMLKSHILFGDGDLLDMFQQGYNAVMTYIKDGYIYGTSDIHGNKVNSIVESLSSFWPGMQVKMNHQYIILRFLRVI